MEELIRFATNFVASAVDRLWAKLGNVLSFPFLTSADDRLHIAYLISAIVLAVLLYYFRDRYNKFGAAGVTKFLIPKEVYLHKSAKTDYILYLSNRVLFKIIGLPTVIATFVGIGKGLEWLLTETVGELIPKTEAGPAVQVAYAVAVFAAYDFGAFISHYMHHKVPTLWELHKVHHTAEVLTPITNYRFHPIERLISSTLRGVSVGAVAGIFTYLYTIDPRTPSFMMIWVLEVGVLLFAFNIFANLRHSHIWLSFGPRLERIFISPAQHQVHHSSEPRHFDKNFGTVFAFWDAIFGTLYVPKGRERFRIGLYGGGEEAYHSIWRIYVLPMRNAWQVIRDTLKKRRENRVQGA